MKARGRFGCVWKAQLQDRYVAVKSFYLQVSAITIEASLQLVSFCYDSLLVKKINFLI